MNLFIAVRITVNLASEGTRTPNPLVRSQVLYPLSYRCTNAKGGIRTPMRLLPLPPQGSASASFATFALGKKENICEISFMLQILLAKRQLLEVPL